MAGEDPEGLPVPENSLSLGYPVFYHTVCGAGCQRMDKKQAYEVARRYADFLRKSKSAVKKVYLFGSYFIGRAKWRIYLRQN